jgi:hypothetical protein
MLPLKSTSPQSVLVCLTNLEFMCDENALRNAGTTHAAEINHQYGFGRDSVFVSSSDMEGYEKRLGPGAPQQSQHLLTTTPTNGNTYSVVQHEECLARLFSQLSDAIDVNDCGAVRADELAAIQALLQGSEGFT